MNIISRNSFQELEEMAERLNRFFSPSFKRGKEGMEGLALKDWAPLVDITETENEYLIKAELPEVKRPDVRVTAQGGILTILGERRAEKEEKGKKFHRIERSYGSFERSFDIPDDADELKVTADFKEGILMIHLPKTEKAKPRLIEVKVA